MVKGKAVVLETNVYDDIHKERLRAHNKHVNRGGSCELREWDDPEWLAILGEEFGEVCRAICDREPIDHMRDELIQVAAMSAAWACAIDRRMDAAD